LIVIVVDIVVIKFDIYGYAVCEYLETEMNSVYKEEADASNQKKSENKPIIMCCNTIGKHLG
jgi:hypothetical protein